MTSDRAEQQLDLRLLVPALVAWAVLASVLAAPTWVGWLSLALGSGAVAASARGLLPPLLGLAGACTVLLLASAAATSVTRQAGPLDSLVADRAQVTVEGLVTGEARAVTGLQGDPAVLRTVVVSQVSGRGVVGAAHADVLVRGGRSLQELPWRSTVRLSGRLAPVESPGREVAVLQLRDDPVIVSGPAGWVEWADAFRSALRTSVASAPPDAAGLVPSLVAGDTSGMPPDLTEAMRWSGLSHLTAVSGANVTIVVGLVLALCRGVGLGRRARTGVGLAALLAFVAVARPEPSVVRAALMGAVGLLALSSVHRGRAAPALAASVLVALTWDPWLSWSPGFALSVTATAGLVVFAGTWTARWSARCPRALRWAVPALAVTASATLATTPIVVALQGFISLVTLPANLAAAPLVPMTTIGGLVAGVVTLLWPGAGSWIGAAVAVPAQGITLTARWCAAVPGAIVSWPQHAAGAALALALVLAMLFLGRAGARWARARPLLLALVVATSLGWSLPATAVTWPPSGWQVVFCDVGQGDAAVISTGPGRALLVDTGPDPAAVDRCLDRLGVEIVEAVLLSHFHADHVGGLAGALSGREVASIVTSPVHEPASQVRAVREVVGGIPLHDLAAGTTLTWGDLRIEVWSPTQRFAGGSVPNNGSLVLAVDTGSSQLLLTGDIEREAAASLAHRVVQTPQMLGFLQGLDVLKSPHHGSANLDERLMRLVAAPVSVISVGANNDFGHPNPLHLQLLASLGSQALRTDLCGAVAVTADADRTRVVTERPCAAPP